MTLIKEGNLNSSQDGNVFNTEGLSQSLSAGHGNVPKIIIPSNTKQGHGIAQTLETQSSQIVVVGNLHGEDGHNVHNVISDQGICPTVRSNHGSVQPGQVAQNPLRWARTEKGKDNRRESQKEGKDYTPFSDGNRELIPTDDENTGCITGALNKDALIGVSITDDQYPNRAKREYMDRSPTIHSKAGNLKVSNIRRLTEIECERLQGFPDNWTEYGNYDGVVRKIPKTQRYKLLGNAVTVKIVEEIGKRLIKNFE
jgi:site-specific DNA-cytosine methylase